MMKYPVSENIDGWLFWTPGSTAIDDSELPTIDTFVERVEVQFLSPCIYGAVVLVLAFRFPDDSHYLSSLHISIL